MHAKTARGEMARYCALRQLTEPEALKQFKGSHGEWTFVPSESTDLKLTFKRTAIKASVKSKATPAKRAHTQSDVDTAPPPAKSKRQSKQ